MGMLPYSRRDSWDYIRIDPEAVAVSKAQAEVLARLPDDTKQMLFVDLAGSIKYLLPEHRHYVLSTLGNVVSADSIPVRGATNGKLPTGLDGIDCSPLSDDEAAWVVIETLQIVEKEGRKLRRRLDNAVNRLDREQVLRVLSDNIWCSWFLSHIIAPFLDDYAVVLDRMGIDPELIRAQSLSLQQARGKMAVPVDEGPTVADGPKADMALPSQTHPAGQGQTAGGLTRTGSTALPLGLGASTSASPLPNTAATVAPALRTHALAQFGTQPLSTGSPMESTAEAVPGQAFHTAVEPPADSASPPAPVAPSLPSTQPAQQNRTYATTVKYGSNEMSGDAIEGLANLAPPLKEQETRKLVNGYISLLAVSDALEKALRSDLPDAGWEQPGALKNTTLLPVIRHPLGKAFAVTVSNRLASAAEFLTRADAAEHVTPELEALAARFKADTGQNLPGQRAVHHALTDQTAQGSTQQIGAVGTTMVPPSQSSVPDHPASGTGPRSSTVPAAEWPPTVAASPQHSAGLTSPAPASTAHAGVAPAHMSGSAYPQPQTVPPQPTAQPLPAASPATRDPATANPAAPVAPAPARIPGPPDLPPLTADPLVLFAPARPSNPPRGLPSDRRTPAQPETSARPAPRGATLAMLFAPFAVAYDGFVHWRQTRRKAAITRRTARRCPVPPPATRPRSTAARSFWHAIVLVLVLVGCVAGALLGVQVYRAPPAWLFATQTTPSTRYVVAAQPVLVPVFPTAEAARMPKVEPGVTPVIRPDISYPVLSSQGDVLQIAITTRSGKSAGWVSAPLMREVLPPQ